MGRQTRDPREDTLIHLAEALARLPLGLQAPSACLLLADCLLAWVQHPGDRRKLTRAWSRSRAFDDDARLPLFSASGTDEVDPDHIELVATRLAAHPWRFEDGELLGHCFETILHPEHRKSHGAYYTPRKVVDYLLEHCLPPEDRPLPRDFRLLDPSCGAGNFLSVALEALYERVWTPLEGVEGRFQRMKRVLEHHLMGIDRDPWAIRLAQARLRFVQHRLVGARARSLEARLLVMDTLRDHHAMLEPGFDVVLGNPPYGAEVGESDRRFFQRHYALGQGRTETTALFLERSVRLLRKGGRLAMVVPHGVTRTGGYAATRDLLIDTLQPRALLDCGAIFPGVNLEAIAFVCQAPVSSVRAGMPWAPEARNLVRLDSLREGELTAIGTQNVDFYRGRPTMPMYVVHPHEGWVQRLERSGPPLRDLAALRRGAGVSSREPALARRRDGIPVIRGRDVSRYGPLQDLHRLHPQAYLQTRLHREILPEGRVGYQNIASAVVATWFPAGVVPLDTVNVVEPRCEVDPLYLLGFLGSRLTDAYFQSVLANRARLTLHLDAPTLGPLPVILPSGAEQRAIGEHVQRVLEHHLRTSEATLLGHLKDDLHESPASFRDAVESLWSHRETGLEHARSDLAAIDERIEALAGMSRTESEYLRTCLSTPPKQPLTAGRGNRWARELIVAGCLEVLEASTSPRSVHELIASWERPDREILLRTWGGDSLEDLNPVLIRAGAHLRNGRLSWWEPGLELVAT